MGGVRFQVMLEACKLELFDELDKAPQTTAGLAKVKGWQLDPLRRLMDSAVSLKLLNRSTDRCGQGIVTDIGPTYICRLYWMFMAYSL